MRSTQRAWLVVALLWPVALLNYLDRLMITTMRDPIVADVPMSAADFGLLTSVFLWVYGLLSPAGGYLADRYGRRRVIIASLAVWSVVTWSTGHATTLNEMLLARGLMGISEACYIPAALAMIADFHPGRTRSLATGIHTSGTYLGAALGGLGGIVAEQYGWRAAFSVFGVVGVVYAPLLIWSLPGKPDVEDEPQPSRATPSEAASFEQVFRALASQRWFWLLGLINVLVGVSNWVVYAWLPTYLRERFTLGLGMAGISATAYVQIASFVATLAGGAWADDWSRSQPRARAWVPAIGYLLAGPFLFLAATVDLLPLAILGLIVFGLGRGMFDANHMPLVRKLVPARASATAYGVLNFVSCMAGGVMIYAGGAIKDAELPLALVFQAAAVGLFLAGALLALMGAACAPKSDDGDS